MERNIAYLRRRMIPKEEVLDQSLVPHAATSRGGFVLAPHSRACTNGMQVHFAWRMWIRINNGETASQRVLKSAINLDEAVMVSAVSYLPYACFIMNSHTR